MDLGPDGVSALTKEQIKHFDDQIESKGIGTVMTAGGGISLVHGLDNTVLGELLLFPNDVYRVVMDLEEDNVDAVLPGSEGTIKEGDEMKRTGKTIEVPVGDGLLGHVVNPLGQPIDGQEEIVSSKTRPIEGVTSGIMTRKPVDQPSQTGITSIDAIVPIGRGRRELIVDDRQVGKTAITIDTILNQKGQNIYCVCIVIEQKNSAVAQVIEKLRKGRAMEYTTIASTGAGELTPVRYIAPYTGSAMAEGWLSQGRDVLIVYDDLSKHAVAYHTVSLLLKKPPGRETYPGDVFYSHSRLLERTCRLNERDSGGSITALPIIETQAGDISAYIPANVISIIGGQIFLQRDLFDARFRPAIDTGLSAGRVGSSAQVKAVKQVSGSLEFELAQLAEVQTFAQFDSDLDAATKTTLDHDEEVREVLKQAQYSSHSVEEQMISLFALRYEFTKAISVTKISQFVSKLYEEMKFNHTNMIEDIRIQKAISEELTKQLKEVMGKFVEKSLKVNKEG